MVENIKGKIKFRECPDCGKFMSIGFSCKSTNLCYISPSKIVNFVFIHDNLNKPSLVEWVLPVSKTTYSLSYICTVCEIYLVEYNYTLTSDEAKRLANLLQNKELNK